MASYRSTKKGNTFKELLIKTPVKVDSPKDAFTALGREDETAGPTGDDAPVMWSFLEHLVGVLRKHFATLKQDIASKAESTQKKDRFLIVVLSDHNWLVLSLNVGLVKSCGEKMECPVEYIRNKNVRRKWQNVYPEDFLVQLVKNKQGQV
ncbi:hypothetical protein NDU88_001338 [Pleurodeles waltl]|uniref:Uncharacterized protein n=1 Tax=Pleurodeles waltl TaxID=8319 RepID=A0AAV7Q2U3_PLEWA|nr:hypothetical protein NDU88_001338 [Pleurodeles waltl]